MGILEALGWIEAFGDQVLTAEEGAWAERAAQRRGCRLKRHDLTPEDQARILALAGRVRDARMKDKG